MSEPLRYPVPWDLVARLGPDIARGSRADIGRIYREIVARMNPAPVYEGLEHLPESPRFVLAANHYQRQGLWIAHASAAVACALEDRYHSSPPIRWLVTANWPPWRLGPLRVSSPGDILLPRVARATWCYAVPFSGTNPIATARSLRRLLEDAAGFQCPLGIYPEGAHALAGQLEPPLPGIGRLFLLMARKGFHVQPIGISESGRLMIRFGAPVSTAEIIAAGDPGQLVMDRVAIVCK